jgi:hypothetical protein
MKSELDSSGSTLDSDRVGGGAGCSAHSPVMSTTKQIPRDQWREYFDRFTKEHLKAKSQAFEVLLENVDHLIFHPAEIWVLEGGRTSGDDRSGPATRR